MNETRDQRRSRLVRLANDPDHFVDVEQHDAPPLEDVDPIGHALVPVALDGNCCLMPQHEVPAVAAVVPSPFGGPSGWQAISPSSPANRTNRTP